MKHAAFLSMKMVEGWCVYDTLLVEPLRKRLWSVDTIDWHQYSNVDWKRYDVVVARSCWDYQDHLGEFAAALRFIQKANPDIVIENSVDTMLWNSRKTYCRDLAAGGCPIIPSVFLCDLASSLSSSSSSSFSRSDFDRMLAAAFERFGEVLFKPIVGASSFGAYRISREEFLLSTEKGRRGFLFCEDAAILKLRDGALTMLAPEDEARRGKHRDLGCCDKKKNDDAEAADHASSSSPSSSSSSLSPSATSVWFESKADFLWSILRANAFDYVMQPFVRSITSFGEYSIFFFGGRPSHAIHKLPRAGDFRVQEEYDAVHSRVALAELPADVLAAGRRIFECGRIPSSRPPLYCRADLVAVPRSVMKRGRGWGVTAAEAEAAAAAGGEKEDHGHDHGQGYYGGDDDDSKEDDGGEKRREIAVIEAELIEPSLYFNLCAEGIENFVDEFVLRFGEGGNDGSKEDRREEKK